MRRYTLVPATDRVAIKFYIILNFQQVGWIIVSEINIIQSWSILSRATDAWMINHDGFLIVHHCWSCNYMRMWAQGWSVCVLGHGTNTQTRQEPRDVTLQLTHVCILITRIDVSWKVFKIKKSLNKHVNNRSLSMRWLGIDLNTCSLKTDSVMMDFSPHLYHDNCQFSVLLRTQHMLNGDRCGGSPHKVNRPRQATWKRLPSCNTGSYAIIDEMLAIYDTETKRSPRVCDSRVIALQSDIYCMVIGGDHSGYGLGLAIWCVGSMVHISNIPPICYCYYTPTCCTAAIFVKYHNRQ